MSPLLSTAQLAGLRKVAHRGLTDTAVVLRATEVENDFGTETVWATVYLDVPCWVRQMKASNIIDVVMHSAVIGDFRILFPVGTDIDDDDNVVVAGQTYSVTNNNTEDTIQVFCEVTARKVE